MTNELQELQKQRSELLATIKAAESAYVEHKASTAIETASLRTQADGLAAQFRSLFAQASAAYAAKSPAAKGFAAQGKALEAQCRALNKQAGQAQNKLKDEREAIRSLRADLATLDAQIRNARQRRRQQAPRSRTPPRPPSPKRALLALPSDSVRGFHRAKGISFSMVQGLLSHEPARIVEQIDSVVYLDRVAEDQALGRTKAKPNLPERARILMFKHPLYELDAELMEQPYEEALVHEVGHVLFERVMTASQRQAWGDLFIRNMMHGGKWITDYAKLSLREDFGECFRFYRLNPSTLREKQNERYTFIDSIYKELGE